MTHIISGSCHCGNLSYRLATAWRPEEIRARACDCRFCRMHAAIAWSDPDGQVHIRIADQGNLQRYRFALRTADFYLCQVCGLYCCAVLQDGRDAWATVNLRLSGLEIPYEPANYGAEDMADRVARRKRVWTPALLVSEGLRPGAGPSI